MISPTLTKKHFLVFVLFFCKSFKWLDVDDAGDDEADGDPSDRLNLPVQCRTTCRCHRLHRLRCCAPSSAAVGGDSCHWHHRKKTLRHRYYPHHRWIYSCCSAYHPAVDPPTRLLRPAGLFCALSSDFGTKL